MTAHSFILIHVFSVFLPICNPALSCICLPRSHLCSSCFSLLFCPCLFSSSVSCFNIPFSAGKQFPTFARALCSSMIWISATIYFHSTAYLAFYPTKRICFSLQVQNINTKCKSAIVGSYLNNGRIGYINHVHFSQNIFINILFVKLCSYKK